MTGAISSHQPVYGQAQTLPAQQNPGLLTTPLRQNTLAQPNARPPEEVHLELPENEPIRAKVDSPAFPVKQIQVQGVTLFKPEVIRQLTASYENREESLSELNALVDALAKQYHQKGYLLAQVYIPPQEIENGTLVIQVQEGSVDQVNIEGNRFYRASVIKRFLHEKSGEPLNFKTLETDLNRSNRLNNFKLKAILSAGKNPGQTNIRLQTAERLPLQISPTFDNQGRPFIGMYRAGVELRNDSVTGLGDHFYGRWLAGSGTRIWMGSYGVPLNRFGTELGANFASSNVNVDLGIENPPEITGKALSYGLSLTQPLNESRTLVADLGANWRSIKTTFNGDITSDTQIRSLDIGLTWNKADRFGRTYNRLQSTMGIGVLGANSRFWKLENYFNRMIVLPKNNLLLLRAYGQFTPDSLPSAEQFQIGGFSSVRGYTEGLLIGDRGINLGAEWRFPIPGLKKINPWLGNRIQGAVFYDYGRVWQDSSNRMYVANKSNKAENTMLHSVGFGFRTQLTRFAQGFLDFGFGLVNRDIQEPHSQPTARIHFGVRSDFLPENYRVWGRLKPYTPRISNNLNP
jgi:hemolysin activation/secretion protein